MIMEILGLFATLDETFSGLCPVQAFGTIGDRCWYFRARGQHWSVAIGHRCNQSDHHGSYVRPDGADLYVCGPADDVAPYAAGHMGDQESERHLTFALTLYARGIRGVARVPNPPTMLPPCFRCGAATADRWRSMACCSTCTPTTEASNVR